MNPRRSGQSEPEDEDCHLPKAMRVAKVRTFAQRVWEEEVIRAIRNMKEVLGRKASDSPDDKGSEPYRSIWSKAIWRTRVKAALSKIKSRKSPRKVSPLKPTTHPWKFPDEP